MLENFYPISIDVTLHKPKDKSELLNLMSEIQKQVSSSEIYPILHFECHGSTDRKGLVFESTEGVTWTELLPFFETINLASRCNLILVFGSCFGLHFLSGYGYLRPCPAWMFVGALETVTADNSDIQLQNFYRALYSGAGAGELLGSLKDSSGKNAYFAMTSELAFVKTMRMMNGLLMEQGASPYSLEQIRLHLRFFLMADRFPEIEERLSEQVRTAPLNFFIEGA